MEKNIINIDAHVIDDIRTIITRARSKAYQSINETLIRSNWEIGKRIVEEEQLGKQRADYGIQLIKSISQQLTTEFGSGYGVRNLAYFKQLYQYFPDWEILHTRVQNLSWSHLTSLQERLFAMQDKQYAAFQAKLTPGVPMESFIGIRVPVLRKFAKEFTKETECKEYLRTLKIK